MGNLKKRLITGTVYVLLIAAFFLLKIFVSELFFDLLILIFAFFGTGEMLRAFGDKLHRSQKILTVVFALLVIATYAVSDFYYTKVLGIGLPDQEITQARGRNYSMHITFIVLIAGMAILASLLVFAHRHVTLESTGYALLCYIYPSFFLLVLTICNYSELAVLLVFIVAPFADSFAFVFGKLLGKKLPAKMAPNISPKKTIIGGFGGLLGGAVAAVVILFM